ncbi:PaaX family transcriptional regulator C-terminal domain-containing protein [Actibacterium sp. XHP0104]|uniref:PaaX family transcriptional regulator C-terminal domain-containing protein n=1 Tax=Actibacterium sp. XHP0104 TaxID=2984335 RepID=UPI0021E8B04F|nr:PaaX family transcriptional regulator C-terminal domain-containing protein [Actibacterium sp. XHP0104]MCV2882739.1 ArsR family transcriptional regulator [Actibacterium sp. XHP0104]
MNLPLSEDLRPGGAIRQVLEADPPRATRFIVTIYGDAVVPRGGTLWMGTLIECCAWHGLSESLVRTAVSRLVGAGRLVGDRIGRKSYYRLTEAARGEFAHAARLLYAPPQQPEGWMLLIGAPDDGCDRPWASLGQGQWIAPARCDLTMPPGIAMAGDAIAGEGALPDLAHRLWPLAEVAQAYQDFIDGFTPVLDRIEAGQTPGGAGALALRLRLVDAYRQAALADPRLPAGALPGGWPAQSARRLFGRIYLALASAADAHIGDSFFDSEGTLPARSAETDQRLALLRAEVSV